MTTPSTPGTRDRDVRIAKLLGWRVEWLDKGNYAIYKPCGKLHYESEFLCRENEAWNRVPHYSTDIRDAAVLLVDVLLMGWRVTESVADKRVGQHYIEQ